jgi:hypothetical protein
LFNASPKIVKKKLTLAASFSYTILNQHAVMIKKLTFFTFLAMIASTSYAQSNTLQLNISKLKSGIYTCVLAINIEKN